MNVEEAEVVEVEVEVEVVVVVVEVVDEVLLQVSYTKQV